MSSSTLELTATSAGTTGWAPWIVVLSGIAVLYVPSFIDLLRHAEQPDDIVNTLFIFVTGIWFLRFRMRQLMRAGKLEEQRSWWGGPIFAAGLALYVLGRSQQLPTLEIGSLIPLLAGIVALFFGLRSLGRLWLALLLLMFIVPLPASVAAEVTQPVKLAVSAVADKLMRGMGYPVARDGVVLAIGQYRLLVADACSGLRSLFTLEALGLMYVTCLERGSAWRNSLLALLIVPVSFTANTLRVVVLALITYYFGDAAGQGFLHNFAGIMLFMSALLLIVVIDAVLTRIAQRYEWGGVT